MTCPTFCPHPRLLSLAHLGKVLSSKSGQSLFVYLKIKPLAYCFQTIDMTDFFQDLSLHSDPPERQLPFSFSTVFVSRHGRQNGRPIRRPLFYPLQKVTKKPPVLTNKRLFWYARCDSNARPLESECLLFSLFCTKSRYYSAFYRIFQARHELLGASAQGYFGAHKHQINTKSMKQKPYFFKPKIWGILRVVASTRGRFADSTLRDRPH